MTKIKIIKRAHIYSFEDRDLCYDSLFDYPYRLLLSSSYSQLDCEYCKITTLDNKYVQIINRLKDHGYLDKDYKMICCVCAEIIRKNGSLCCNDCGRKLILRYTFNGYTDVACYKCLSKKTWIRQEKNINKQNCLRKERNING